jgi:hypothetical protein
MEQDVDSPHTDALKPESIYAEAMFAFRHYDTLSTTVIGGIPILLAGVLGLTHTMATAPWRGLVALTGSLLTWILFQLYARLDTHAGTALKVAAAIERGEPVNGKKVKGLASTRQGLRTHFPSLASSPGGKIYSLVRLMTWVSITAQLLLVLIWLLSLKGWLDWV